MHARGVAKTMDMLPMDQARYVNNNTSLWIYTGPAVTPLTPPVTDISDTINSCIKVSFWQVRGKPVSS